MGFRFRENTICDYFNIFILLVWVFTCHVCTTWRAHREAATVVINDVSHQVGAGSQTCVLGESSQCSYSLSHLSKLHDYFWG